MKSPVFSMLVGLMLMSGSFGLSAPASAAESKTPTAQQVEQLHRVDQGTQIAQYDEYDYDDRDNNDDDWNDNEDDWDNNDGDRNDDDRYDDREDDWDNDRAEDCDTLYMNNGGVPDDDEAKIIAREFLGCELGIDPYTRDVRITDVDESGNRRDRIWVVRGRVDDDPFVVRIDARTAEVVDFDGNYNDDDEGDSEVIFF